MSVSFTKNQIRRLEQEISALHDRMQKSSHNKSKVLFSIAEITKQPEMTNTGIKRAAGKRRLNEIAFFYNRKVVTPCSQQC